MEFRGSCICEIKKLRREHTIMANQYYKSFEELPVMLTIPQVASVLSISRAGAY